MTMNQMSEQLMTDDDDSGPADSETPNPETEPLLDGQTIERSDTDTDSKDFDSEQ